MRLREGHQDTSVHFTNAYTANYHRLCAYAYQFVNDHYAAEDIVQNCFLKFWERIEKIDFSYDTATLLYLMTRQAVYEYLHKRKDEPMALESLEVLAKENVVNEIIYSETLSEIYYFGQHLPDKCGEIFRRIFEQGKEHNEVAKELNITESTIRTQKSRAISFIKHHLHRTAHFFMLFC